MAKSSSLSTKSLVILIVSTVFVLFSVESLAEKLEYHNGGVLSGNLDLSVLWYGRFGESQQQTLKQFVLSLNVKNEDDLSVSKWWNIVEQYQSLAAPGGKISPIRVRIVKEQVDNAYTFGKVLTQESIGNLTQKIAGNSSKSVVLIFTDHEVSVNGTCSRRCSLHGSIKKTLYMVVGNHESKCPNECGWPFHQPKSGQKMIFPLQPPSGDVGTDTMVIGLATALAETVSNPYNTGLYSGLKSDPIEVVSGCPKVFGSDAFAGFVGKVLILPGNGGCYNARGVKGSKFLLPALWNSKTRSCWTPL